MANQNFRIVCLVLICLGIYLFVSAPPPLEDKQAVGTSIPVVRMFEILKTENDAVRSLWTKEIVGMGKQSGLKFDEHWRDEGIDAGPLPALFLRETAKSLERNPSPLSLFLGSDYPINEANRFEGLQLDKFQSIKQTQQPQFFYMPDIQMQVAMFSDLAISEGCVQCHNAHGQSPKKDWKLNDVMGATTWMYPASTVSMDEVLQTVMALHLAFREAYESYIEKARKFTNPPIIGDQWPSQGYYLPTPDQFMQEIIKRTAPHTLERLTSLSAGTQPASTSNLSENSNLAH